MVSRFIGAAARILGGSCRDRSRARISSSWNVLIPLSVFFQKYSTCPPARFHASAMAPTVGYVGEEGVISGSFAVTSRRSTSPMCRRPKPKWEKEKQIAQLKQHPELGWISALKAGAIRQLVEAGTRLPEGRSERAPDDNLASTSRPRTYLLRNVRRR
jgi:hypothetical protein